jgi:chaperone modulatory protein CbpM
MQQGELIPAGVFCEYHHVELSFIRNLYDSGLIGMTIQDGAVFLSSGELPELEKFVRWHYELSINPEGIEAIAHLLGRVNALWDENQALRNKLQRFESGGRGPVEPGVVI